MVMGPTHAMSGAAGWLAAATLATPLVGTHPLPVVAVGAAVCAGSALLPDLDCPGSLSSKDGSTVVRAFGYLGEAVGHTLNALSLAIYNLTRTRKDPARNDGHRTFTHTAVFALILGAAVSALTTLPGTMTVLGEERATGDLAAIAIMGAMLHLALFGLCEKWAKKTRAKHGLLGVAATSAALTAATLATLPPGQNAFTWLGLAVGLGAAIHCLGDAITKMGVPFLWPVPINGRRWWDITLPAAFRIRAGGTFEYAVLLPALTLATVVLAAYATPGGRPLVDAAVAFIR